MHATQWSGLTSLNSGIPNLQSSIIIGHRVWNTHPSGGFIGLGTSPVRMMRSLCASITGSGIGTPPLHYLRMAARRSFAGDTGGSGFSHRQGVHGGPLLPQADRDWETSAERLGTREETSGKRKIIERGKAGSQLIGTRSFYRYKKGPRR